MYEDEMSNTEILARAQHLSCYVTLPDTSDIFFIIKNAPLICQNEPNIATGLLTSVAYSCYWARLELAATIKNEMKNRKIQDAQMKRMYEMINHHLPRTSVNDMLKNVQCFLERRERQE